MTTEHDPAVVHPLDLEMQNAALTRVIKLFDTIHEPSISEADKRLLKDMNTRHNEMLREYQYHLEIKA